jgi:hypothetical protein
MKQAKKRAKISHNPPQKGLENWLLGVQEFKAPKSSKNKAQLEFKT